MRRRRRPAPALADNEGLVARDREMDKGKKMGARAFRSGLDLAEMASRKARERRQFSSPWEFVVAGAPRLSAGLRALIGPASGGTFSGSAAGQRKRPAGGNAPRRGAAVGRAHCPDRDDDAGIFDGL